MEESISLVDRLKPYQYLYDIISYRIEADLHKTKEKLMATTNYSYNTPGYWKNEENMMYSSPNFNYGTKGQVDNSTLKEKLEKTLPEYCLIRSEDGSLKKVTKAEAIEFELKSCIVEQEEDFYKWNIPVGKGIENQIESFYKNTISQEPELEVMSPRRDYTFMTNEIGMNSFNDAMERYSGAVVINPNNNWNQVINTV